jgi:hypothetical protein
VLGERERERDGSPIMCWRIADMLCVVDARYLCITKHHTYGVWRGWSSSAVKSAFITQHAGNFLV